MGDTTIHIMYWYGIIGIISLGVLLKMYTIWVCLQMSLSLGERRSCIPWYLLLFFVVISLVRRIVALPLLLHAVNNSLTLDVTFKAELLAFFSYVVFFFAVWMFQKVHRGLDTMWKNIAQSYPDWESLCYTLNEEIERYQSKLQKVIIQIENDSFQVHSLSLEKQQQCLERSVRKLQEAQAIIQRIKQSVHFSDK